MICYFTDRLLDVTKSEICARSLTSNLETSEKKKTVNIEILF